MCSAELAITAAMAAVESLPPHDRLTAAVVLLGQARDAVADYVDGGGPVPPQDIAAEQAAIRQHYLPPKDSA